MSNAGETSPPPAHPHTPSRRRFLTLAGGALIGSGTYLLNPGASSAHTTDQSSIIIGIPTFIIDTAPHTIAAKRGYFEERGLTVQIVDTRAGVVAVQRGLSGETVMGNSNIVSWMQSVASGVKNKAVLQTAFYDLDHRVNGLLIRSELWKKGEIRSIEDLPGHTIAIHGGKQSIMDFSTRLTLEKFGIDPTSVTRHFISYGEHPAAMASGTIDVTPIVDPLYTKMVDDGTGVPLPDPEFGGKFDVNLHAATVVYDKPVFPIAVTWAVPDFASRAPESLIAYYDGYAKATQFIQSYPERADDMIAEITGIDLNVIQKITWPAFNPLPRVKEIQSIADTLNELGWMKSIDVSGNTFTKV